MFLKMFSALQKGLLRFLLIFWRASEANPQIQDVYMFLLLTLTRENQHVFAILLGWDERRAANRSEEVMNGTGVFFEVQLANLLVCSVKWPGFYLQAPSIPKPQP